MEYISFHKISIKVILGFEAYSWSVLILYNVGSSLGIKINVTMGIVTRVSLSGVSI